MVEDEAQGIVEIYTDGACSGNPGPGGWAAVLRYGHHEKEIYGSEPGPTTNNRMELLAPIRALELLTRPSVVDVYTDSNYVRNGITSWLPRWKSNGWRTQSKQPVKNADLWQRLESATAQHKVRWHWVKGHAGHPDNERADRLAVKGAQEAVPATAPAVGDDECVHEMPIKWCGSCSIPVGVLPNGFRTEGGSAYHNDPDCEWLRKGQNYAHRLGKNVHAVESVSWASVDTGQLQPCESCCTDEWIRRHRPISR